MQGSGVDFNRIAGPNSSYGIFTGIVLAQTRWSIFVALLPANTLSPKPDPLVLLAGGTSAAGVVAYLVPVAAVAGIAVFALSFLKRAEE